MAQRNNQKRALNSNSIQRNPVQLSTFLNCPKTASQIISSWQLQNLRNFYLLDTLLYTAGPGSLPASP